VPQIQNCSTILVKTHTSNFSRICDKVYEMYALCKTFLWINRLIIRTVQKNCGKVFYIEFEKGLRNEDSVLLGFTTCSQVNRFRSFEEFWCLRLWGLISHRSSQLLNAKTLCFFEVPVFVKPSTQHNILEDQHPHHQRSEKLKCLPWNGVQNTLESMFMELK